MESCHLANAMYLKVEAFLEDTTTSGKATGNMKGASGLPTMSIGLRRH